MKTGTDKDKGIVGTENTRFVKGKTYTHSDGKRYKYLGKGEDGNNNWQGSLVKKSKMKKVKTQSNTNYKSTGSKKGKATPRKKRRKSLM